MRHFGRGFPGFDEPRGRQFDRGDVKYVLLDLLREGPRHGYDMIKELEQRSGGLYSPSPGSVYPTLQLLVDEGLLVARESDGSKKLFELTEEGRAATDKIEVRLTGAGGHTARPHLTADLVHALGRVLVDVPSSKVGVSDRAPIACFDSESK